ncbi:hypothetical protein I4F81_000014 [Pyropia yezoensis]|uniref:Uncharacterized protein n=1 Tax=Pyropia yezoensis TaxID=2788 RepID=A0ACC3BHN5_PYRYE|nr:hypothetical protein I4F81_000014 [Neopyropia yezoensis]
MGIPPTRWRSCAGPPSTSRRSPARSPPRRRHHQRRRRRGACGRGLGARRRRRRRRGCRRRRGWRGGRGRGGGWQGGRQGGRPGRDRGGGQGGGRGRGRRGCPPRGASRGACGARRGGACSVGGRGRVVVTILHATLPPFLPIWGPDPLFTSDALLSAEILAEDRRRSLAAAASLRAHAGRLHLPAQVVTRPGDPREVVPEYIAKAGADLLVVGSRGLSGLSKLLLGSVSSYLVANVACPVVVYRPAKEDDA